MKLFDLACTSQQLEQDPTLRPRIWKILLQVTDIPADLYLYYVSRGPCQVREKIRNDTFRCASTFPCDRPTRLTVCRTLATDKGFKERVREDMLVRLLDAFVWRSHGTLNTFHNLTFRSTHLSDRGDTDQLGFTYVQGMNVLAAPFLYTMPSEVEAFFCFAKFIEESCPLYVQPTLEGVHRGLKVRHTLTIGHWRYSQSCIVAR